MTLKRQTTRTCSSLVIDPTVGPLEVLSKTSFRGLAYGHQQLPEDL